MSESLRKKWQLLRMYRARRMFEINWMTEL